MSFSVHRRSTSASNMHVLTFLRQTEPETQEISRAAEVFQTTLQVLKNRARQRYKREVTTSELSECLIPLQSITCPQDDDDKYRTITGLCNNRQNPLWGAANTPFVRWLPAEYEDEEREPKGWNPGRLYNGFQLPLVRQVSQEILRSCSKPSDDAFSQMLVEWGQYINHDITFTAQSPGTAMRMSGVDCLNTCENVHPCFPIKCGEQDCLPFTRSAPACFVNCTSDVRQALQRQQMNIITSFIDASLVYGSTPKQQASLRDLSSDEGKLAVNERLKDPKGRDYLPFVASLPSPCRQDPNDVDGERVECFAAGDTRVNEGLPLTVLHTLFFREHNRIAGELKRINCHWSSETVYQEARKIIGALHQIITMRDYMPKILDQESFDHYIGPYEGYDETVDPSASNVFATAAFRFGHPTISPILMRLDEKFQEHKCFPHLRLHQTLFSQWRIVKEGGIEPILRGMIGVAARTVSPDMLVTEEVAQKLVVLNIPREMDLGSLNLQRGRDHGLPGYNDWRVFCGLSPIKTLDHLKSIVKDTSVAEKILKIYKHLDNIDVWFGGIIESFNPNSRIGPLFSCLMGKQMKALRDGDRFWWEAENVFTQQQKAELSKTSLSRIICDNTDIKEVHPDAFRFEKYPSGYLCCDDIPSINLEAWREEKH
uniref:Thyroid peroxidase n=1 Tax=Sphaeramia orbicularis TaxID=375764 RepID=A0A673C7U8_9TELE